MTSDTTRRVFLDYVAASVLFTIAVLSAIPVVGYLFGPLRRRAEDDSTEVAFSDAGPLTDITFNQWVLVTIELVRRDGWKQTRVKRSVWVRRDGTDDRAIKIISPICPHLGCPVNFQSEKKQFFCPCHGGIFDSDGKTLAGPSPRNLDALTEFKVLNGRLWIRMQDFKVGTADRVPVGV